ncbi:1-deoxy-D-xylulose-5-phosphate reductoisomerase [Sphingomonas sp. RB56-2]|uniref:1-deoxy-D-xylulose 5-phosphate reductoisomerase n=1 Tax=Sphingomonas brevis TaxID=2908206 RepID=A0ABT0S7D4_9SPHN|nr:1-deoxy-D-xylulose-5-phosphate reductoisomerase [Sphingomonas brevis]MCL6740304.1 1-deoxy-D-xylulose-5-phosphate reductoisomerase [Sphingomonas brevis]
MKRRTVSILGATGSVGTSTLDLIERHPDRFEVVALTAARNVEALADAARRTNARLAVIDDETRLAELRQRLQGSGCRAATGKEALAEAAAGEAEWVMAAIVGCAGLEPVMAAIEAGRTVALANKESLVTAGALMTQAAARSGAEILPVDSEHNAIFQCLAGNRPGDVAKLVLTASGGPFRTKSRDEMAAMTPEQAVAHPNWSMGAKISVDSATMMNKGLELIEAHHLFGLPSERIEILVHPQSVIHSMVEYVDGSVLAQLGSPDMRIPIAHALAWPERIDTPAQRLDLARIAKLTFEAPDFERFPALQAARSALEAGGSAPTALNAANEEAVSAFLQRRIGFLDIIGIVLETIARTGVSAPQSIAEVIDIDRKARAMANNLMREMAA